MAQAVRTPAEGTAMDWPEVPEVIVWFDIVTFHRPTGGFLEFVA